MIVQPVGIDHIASRKNQHTHLRDGTMPICNSCGNPMIVDVHGYWFCPACDVEW